MKMNDNTKQVEAANRISKMFLGDVNINAAFGYFVGYISGELRYADAGSVNAEQLERILEAALNYAKTSPKS